MIVNYFPVYDFSEKELIELNENLSLALNISELIAIKNYYKSEKEKLLMSNFIHFHSFGQSTVIINL